MVHFIPLSAIANLCLFWLYMSTVHSASESIPNEVKELLSQNHGKESLELFQNSFDTYQAIVNNDYLEHKSMTQSLTNILNKYVSLSQPKDLAIADLGCGDLALLNHIYKKLPISTFTGVDASLPALEIAKTRLLSSLIDPMSFNWVNGDLLDWAQSHIDNNHKTQQYYDIIICAYSVHHLLDDKKRQFLKAIFKNRLKPNGLLIMPDLFLKGYETRDAYITRLTNDVNENWVNLHQNQKLSTIKHFTENDYPSSYHTMISEFAPEAHATAEVAWTDSKDLFKILVLKSNSHQFSL